jgi:glycogenin glucosyltransferase
MITDGDAYFVGALVLGASLSKYTRLAHHIDMVAMELVSKPLGELAWKRLERVGWKRCQVEGINPVHTPSTNRFADQFTKLRLWGMTVYEKVIYMDCDTLVVGNIDHLLGIKLEHGKQIGATEDFNRRFAGTFNMGVILIHPSQHEYDRLITLHKSDRVQYNHDHCEQGFLNEVYKEQWQEIGFAYNANLIVYEKRRDHWDKYADELTVIHYTIRKPWSCSTKFMEICKFWLRAFYQELRGGTPCQNAEFSPKEKLAIVSMNTGPGHLLYAHYLNSTLNLALSIRRLTKTPVDMVLMELLSNPIPSEDWKLLRDVGWKRCVVPRLDPARRSYRRYFEQFTKLHMWAMTDYESIVYLDLDVFATGPMDNLLGMKLGEYKIGATRDFRDGKWEKDGFSMGISKIHPNRTEYERLMNLQLSDSVDYEGALCDKSWLNIVYKGQWRDLGSKEFARAAAFVETNVTSRNEMLLLHFDNPKPWECSRTEHNNIQAYCSMWEHSIEGYLTDKT